MMQFIKNKQFYQAVKISGPSHNILGLCFVKKKVNKDDIEIIDLVKKPARKIDFDCYKTAVLESLDSINKDLNVNFNVEAIQIISSDTRNIDIYKQLIKEIVLRIHNSFKFSASGISGDS